MSFLWETSALCYTKEISTSETLPVNDTLSYVCLDIVQNSFFYHLLVNAPESDRKDLLSELEVMKRLKPHPHVIKLLGCVTESGNFCDLTDQEVFEIPLDLRSCLHPFYS